MVTPGIKTNEADIDEEGDEPLTPAEATLYRACAARCNFMALDRPDIQYAAKEVSRSMAAPKASDMPKLKRLARYLLSFPRAVLKFVFQRPQEKLRVFSDTDWAGCIKTRKSTQGGVVMIGNNCLKNWSSTQAIIALSSGEAEFYGVVKASSIGLGVQSMFVDMGIQLELEVHTDAEAAKGIASRRGLGKVRHVAVHYLWVQERVAAGDLVLRKVLGKLNPADVLTKHLDSVSIKRNMSIFGIEVTEGRSAIAPSI